MRGQEVLRGFGVTWVMGAVAMAAAAGCINEAADAPAQPQAPQAEIRPTSAAPPQQAIVRGRLVFVGGPNHAATPRPVGPGSVKFAGSAIAEAEVDRAGRYSLQLPAGQYFVTGSTPNYLAGRGECRASDRLTVAAGEVARVDVLCSIR